MPRKQPTERQKKMVYGTCAAIMVFALAAVVLIIVGSLGKGASGGTSNASVKPTQPTQATQAQVTDTEAATVEYRGTQDAAGNAVISFALTNKTDATVLVTAENILVNDQFNVQSITGSVVPIGPEKTGAVAITFGVPTQTTLSGVSDLKTISADLVMVEDGSPTNRVAVVPVSATI